MFKRYPVYEPAGYLERLSHVDPEGKRYGVPTRAGPGHPFGLTLSEVSHNANCTVIRRHGLPCFRQCDELSARMAGCWKSSVHLTSIGSRSSIGISAESHQYKRRTLANILGHFKHARLSGGWADSEAGSTGHTSGHHNEVTRYALFGSSHLFCEPMPET